MPVLDGTISLNGKDITHASIRQRNVSGISHIPEDRHKQDLFWIIHFLIIYNLVYKRYFEPQFSQHGFLKFEEIEKYSEKLIEQQYDIRSGQGSKTIARSMSGGNQQKAIIAREIDKDPDCLIAVQPTRGLDVGAIEYIHKQIIRERDEGKLFYWFSLELDEVMNLSDNFSYL